MTLQEPVAPVATTAPTSQEDQSALAAFLAADPAFKGIGPGYARRLAERFADDLAEALNRCDPAVADVLGDALAEQTCAAFREKRSELAVLAWVERKGLISTIGTATAIRIAQCWGSAGIKALDRNPYLLLAFLPWKVVDAAGCALGISENDPRRLAAAAEAVLYQRIDQNHTWTSLETLEAGVARILHGKDAHRARLDLPLIVDACVASGGAVRRAGGLQPVGAAAMEEFLSTRLSELGRATIAGDLVTRPIPDQELGDAIDTFDRSQPFQMTERQSEAVRLAFRLRFMVLAGYAGSGKTASLKGICEVAERFQRNVHLMALSGRAAQRISESTGRPAMTIARFLTSFVDHASRPLGPDAMVVIDEASMLDLPTLWRIVRKLGDASLVLVGDPAQLPPIGFGLTFHLLVDDPETPKVILDRVLRQSAETGIPVVAEAIRHGDMPEFATFQGRRLGVSFVECQADDTFATLCRIGATLRKDGMRPGEAQIISPVKRGPGGIDAINQAFHERRMSTGDGGPIRFPGRSDIAAGDPIIWTENQWDRGLTNGSMGRLLEVHRDGGVALIDGVEHALTRKDAAYLAPAYAISVHKAQGSQWPIVILSVFRSRLLDRSLLYTAVTRASEQVILVGSREDFRTGISLVSASARDVGWSR